MNYMTLIISLVSGGAFGALITIVYTQYQKRKQPVEYNIKTNTIFIPADISKDHETSITISGNDIEAKEYKFNNLFLAILEVKNTSTIDFENFKFGVFLSNNRNIVKIEFSTLDKKHELNILPKVNFENTRNEIDVELNPFNRQEKYELKLYISGGENYITNGEIEISTKHAIKLVEKTGNKNQYLSGLNLLIGVIAISALILGFMNSKTTYEEKQENIQRAEKILDYWKVLDVKVDSVNRKLERREPVLR
jgi:hypothetical protein